MASPDMSPLGHGPKFPGSIVVMGVSGSGKTSVGKAVAAACGYRFIEGDALHPDVNIAKMSAGIPLTDEDRWPWLREIGRQLSQGAEPLVVSCSALKRSYRALLRDSAGGDLAFVYLHGSRDVLAGRMHHREGHFMPASLLDTQLATLEEPIGEPLTVVADVDQSAADVVKATLAALGGLASSSTGASGDAGFGQR
ncbi:MULTISPECIES: gluconokinase [unclassified Ensifer]|uniref:gluconokinase n=1 Tax=unclassified Ensifer TaxID=2633371 RepID=UPI000813D4EF|nr:MULTISPECIES: gluconokinase [unclassified Ensifer]OCP15816.1 gluconokinase [Ensifer sp. LC54]OCP26165.1 gluconokinase [Ensifer sp. LC384]OCP38469.1 gluconokinase [Ensifer sp. LC163]